MIASCTGHVMRIERNTITFDLEIIVLVVTLVTGHASLVIKLWLLGQRTATGYIRLLNAFQNKVKPTRLLLISH